MKVLVFRALGFRVTIFFFFWAGGFGVGVLGFRLSGFVALGFRVCWAFFRIVLLLGVL